MKIQDILKQPESKTLEFKKEIPKNRQNLLKTIIFRARLTIPPDLEDVFELIKQGVPLGSKAIAVSLNIHQNTALKRLRQLEEKGLIHKQGSGPRVRYSV